MSIRYRRFEILLPLRFNDGDPVPDDLLAHTFLELRTEFGAISVETRPIQGQWEHHGEIYRDELIRVVIDVEDTMRNRMFFVKYKQTIKERFCQIDIWVTSHLIDVV